MYTESLRKYQKLSVSCNSGPDSIAPGSLVLQAGSFSCHFHSGFTVVFFSKRKELQELHITSTVIGLILWCGCLRYGIKLLFHTWILRTKSLA